MDWLEDCISIAEECAEFDVMNEASYNDRTPIDFIVDGDRLYTFCEAYGFDSDEIEREFYKEYTIAYCNKLVELEVIKDWHWGYNRDVIFDK